MIDVYKQVYSIICCRIKYSPYNIDTFSYIRLYEHDKTKNEVIIKIENDGVIKEKRIHVYKELTLLVTCLKCGETLGKVFRLDKNNNVIKKFDEVKPIQIRGKNLDEHLDKIIKSMERVNIKPPYFEEQKTLKYIPLIYFSSSGRETQIGYYLGANQKVLGVYNKSKIKDVNELND